jgi:hypothetical protein
LENFNIFYGHLEYFTDIWDILWPFGTFWVHLVYIHMYFPHFGIVCREKSGNPGCVGIYGRIRNWLLRNEIGLKMNVLQKGWRVYIQICRQNLFFQFCGQCLYLFLSTHKQCILSHLIHNSTAMFPLKPYTLAGFKPGPSHSWGGCMSTAPRRQCNSHQHKQQMWMENKCRGGLGLIFLGKGRARASYFGLGLLRAWKIY